MSTDLSPQNEQFIEHVIARGDFQDRSEALDQAVELLRRRQELLDHVDAGTAQLRRGEGIELRGEAELQDFLLRIHEEGMLRLERGERAR